MNHKHEFPTDKWKLIDPFRDGIWDNLVGSFPDHSVFHTSSWARVLADAYKHKPYYLSLTDENSRRACIPLMEVNSCLTGRRAVSLPFSDYTGAVMDDGFDIKEAFQAMDWLRHVNHWRYVEMRGGNLFSGNEESGSFVQHELDLSQACEQIYAGFQPSVRRAIRKAEQAGVCVTIHDGAEAMNFFYDLQQSTRRRHGLPPQPQRFFSAIWKHLVSNGHGFVSLAHYGNRVIAGAVFLWSGKQAIFKYGASDDVDWNVRPNHALMWHSIQTIQKIGCNMLNFGRSESSNHGLIRYKDTFGTIKNHLHYGLLDSEPDTGFSRIKGMNTNKRYPIQSLPLFMNRMAGNVLYPHLD